MVFHRHISDFNCLWYVDRVRRSENRKGPAHAVHRCLGTHLDWCFPALGGSACNCTSTSRKEAISLTCKRAGGGAKRRTADTEGITVLVSSNIEHLRR